MTTSDSTPIADRVRFWEEQDKINQELIPRVIRQHELLTVHIADHENLPLVAGNAISEALAEAREEQRQFYEAALEADKQEQQQQYDAAQANLDRAVTTLNQEWRKTRNLLIGITAASGAIATAAIILAILI
jgi:DNA-binding helix-hairpin-helix protein with protein kinase domain